MLSTIIGNLEDATGAPQVGKQVEFRPRSAAVDDLVLVAPTNVSTTTIDGGAFSIQLLPGTYDVFVDKYQRTILVPDDGQTHHIGSVTVKLAGGTAPTADIVAVEAQTRIAGDAALDSRIAVLEQGNTTNGTDATARAKADAAQAAADQEKTRAQGAEQTLGDRVAALEAGNTNGVDQTARSKADDAQAAADAEQTRAQDAENTLGDRVTALETAEVVDTTARAKADAAKTAADTEKIRAQQAELDNATALAEEAERAAGAEETLIANLATANATIATQAATIATQAAAIAALQAVAVVVIDQADPDPNDPTGFILGKLYLNKRTGSQIWRRPDNTLSVLSI
jgi:hypothetical protein